MIMIIIIKIIIIIQVIIIVLLIFRFITLCSDILRPNMSMSPSSSLNLSNVKRGFFYIGKLYPLFPISNSMSEPPAPLLGSQGH